MRRDGFTLSTPELTRLPRRWALFCAVASGLLCLLAFPPFGFWPAAIANVSVLNLAAYGQRARFGGLVGLLYGLAFFVPLLHWTGIYVGAFPWLLLAVVQALYPALMGLALPAVLALRGGFVWSAFLFVAQEAVRGSWPFGGFAWARLGFSQPESPLRWFALLGGVPLVSLVVALAGGALAHLILLQRQRFIGIRDRPIHWRRSLPCLVLLVLLMPMALLVSRTAQPAPNGSEVTVALIQGSTPDRGLEFNARRRQVLDNHVNETLALAADIKAGRVARPSIVFWPEDSSDIDPTDNADAAAVIAQAADAVGAPILVGAILDGPGEGKIRNAALLWYPQSGPGEMYVKRHPVPFAEYIPFRSIARRVSSDVALVPNDMVSGGGDGLLTQGPFPFGDVICFEVAYDGLVRSSVAAGAQLLVVQTNNATFGHSAETYQQLWMSQMQAVATARTVLQVSTTGVSAVIDPSGRVVDRTGALFTPGRIVATVRLNSAQTLSTRLGALPEWLIALAGLGAAITAIVALVRSSRAPQELSAATAALGTEHL